MSEPGIRERRRLFEQDFGRLVGEQIARVQYVELAYPDDEQWWNRNSLFDSLDYGFTIESARGNAYHFSWNNEFFPYGLSLAIDLGGGDENVRTWDVTAASRWVDVIGQPITAVTVFWDRVQGEGEEPVYYPQDVVLEFRSGYRIFISALEIRSPDEWYWAMDNLVVIFNDLNLARRYHDGPYGQPAE